MVSVVLDKVDKPRFPKLADLYRLIRTNFGHINALKTNLPVSCIGGHGDDDLEKLLSGQVKHRSNLSTDRCLSIYLEISTAFLLPFGRRRGIALSRNF
jgi:hypothetical protein